MEAQQLTKMGSWDMDIIKRKTYWSEECYRIYGITPEEYDGTFEGFLKFVHPEDIGLHSEDTH
ncbi:MAG: PAS domain-containing protein [Alkalibacterium sp.]|nr:PAS domain-containing protein [Alkalibacterium sp.]